ncbi:centromere protein F-like [Anoplophora glabripennis]|uniref:centromere protein F-like n=1 Tax=Anoplophora glabripennis TaxID=217634 RepID=UPI0008744750|nr:centromere protein F-like [Anoplophora glabripennis]
MTELEKNLIELKKEFTSLQIANIAKEKELSTKFNFESAYKELQVELNERNEEVETLTKSNDELKKRLTKLTTSNQELESSLSQAMANLKDNEDKSKKMMSLNENITLTAAQVQVHLDRKNDMINELVELNKRFENNIEKLEEDLQIKVVEVTKLRDTLEADVEIKNIMWRDNKELKLQLDSEIKKNEKLLVKVKEIEEKHEQEYSELLSNYNTEVERNCELCNQIYTLKADLSSSIKKCNEEVDKNCKLYEQVSALKIDIDSIRENQEKYKLKIDKKLTDYEELINALEKKLQEAESENDKLKTTLAAKEKKKPAKFFDVDLNLSESKSSRSFEKQKLAIDRLKERLESMQEQLQLEKTKREILEQSVKEKDDFEDKYTKSVLDFEQVQCSNILEKQELQNTIIDLSSKVQIHEERSTELENKLRETEESLSLKLSQLEQQNQHLYTELRNNEFVIKNAYLEIDTYKNLYKNADLKAQELSKTISVYLLECNNRQKEIQYLSAQLTDRDNKILSLSSKKADQDIEMSSILNELTEKKNVNLTLEKENKLLQEMLSKSDDHKEKELLDIEEKLKSTRRLLQCSEMELNLIGKKLSDSKEDYEKMSNEITKYGHIITNGKTELSRASNLVLNKWNEILEHETIYKEMILLKDSEPSEKEREICSLDNNIKIAVLLLELLASKTPTSMEGTDFGINSLLNTKTNTNQYSQSDVKMIKKFTLRPSRLHTSRSVSPDSPSADIEGTNSEIPQEINYNTSKEIYISPDNHICQTCPYSSDDSFETAGDDFSFTKDNSIEFTSFQDTFPNISDTFLEKLGLHESSSKKNLTKEKTEELFATFAIQIALDSRDIKERIQKQKDRCVQQHEKFLSLIRDISNRLRDHKCIGAADPISPVFVLLEDVKFLLRDLMQSTQQFGILTCENRMMKCWNLVTNYTALLKQDVVNLRISKPVQESNNQVGTIASFGAKFRKRLQNLNNKDEINCSSSVSSSENAVTHKSRYH